MDDFGDFVIFAILVLFMLLCAQVCSRDGLHVSINGEDYSVKVGR